MVCPDGMTAQRWPPRNTYHAIVEDADTGAVENSLASLAASRFEGPIINKKR